jgi:prolyl-tRNA synthetase
MAKDISSRLDKVLGVQSAKIDRQYHVRPADRFFHHLQRGVPLRIEIGAREFAGNSVRVVRRDTSEKETVSIDALEVRIKDLLSDIQKGMYQRAYDFREKNTRDVSSFEEMKEFFAEEDGGGFARAFFAGSCDDEDEIKSATGGVTIRCMPAGDDARGKCIFTGKDDARRAVFAKAY